MPDPDPTPSARPLPSSLARLESGLIRLTAPNPSPMTLHGTNTYLLGRQNVAVIDPGPDVPGHLEAILAALPTGARVSHILVTHSHLDHSPLAAGLAARTGAKIHAFGDSQAGRSDRMADLAALGALGGGEGVDAAFRPDHRLADGDSVATDEGQLSAIHTPGHFGNHLCFAWKDVLFTGDHVLGWASSLISPPDGDLAAYRASLTRLIGRADRIHYPGHGDPVTAPAERLEFLLRHRNRREAKVRAALGSRFEPLADLLARAYDDTPAALHPAAARNLLAHLIDLTDRNLAEPDRPPGPDAWFRHANTAAMVD